MYEVVQIDFVVIYNDLVFLTNRESSRVSTLLQNIITLGLCYWHISHTAILELLSLNKTQELVSARAAQ